MMKSKCEVLFIAEELDDGLSDDKIVMPYPAFRIRYTG